MNRFILAVAAILLLTGGAQAGVSDGDIANDTTITTQIVSNGMGRHLQRYSLLETLNKDNANNLVSAWAFSLRGEKQLGRETRPLVHDGTKHITGSYSRPFAIAVQTGEIKSHFQTTPREGWDYDDLSEVVAYKNRADDMHCGTADRNGFF